MSTPRDQYNRNMSQSQGHRDSYRGETRDSRGPDRYNKRSYGRGRERDSRDGFRESNNRRYNRDRYDRHGGNEDHEHEDYFEHKTRYTDEELQKVVSIDKIDRSSYTKWDVIPKGLEGITAEKAKLLGLFPLPGPARKNMDSSKFEELIKNQNHKEILDENTRIDPKDSFNAKVVIVNNVLLENEESIVQFVNSFLSSLKIFEKIDDPIKSHKFIQNSLILEFFNYKIATVAHSLLGFSLPDGTVLNLSRPHEYIIPNLNHKRDEEVLKYPFLEDSFNKVTITNIPINLDEKHLSEQIGEEFKFLNILYDKNEISKGIAFAELKDSSKTHSIIDKINNNLTIDTQKLICYRSCAGISSSIVVNYHSLIDAVHGKNVRERTPTKILQLLNLVDYDELLSLNDQKLLIEEIKEIKYDLEKKISTIVPFEKIITPSLQNPINMNEKLHSIGKLKGFGKFFVKFKSIDDCIDCCERLNGMKYFERTVLATYFDEYDFEMELF